MALNYLLSPEFQIVNSAGRPASGGFLEVYVHGTREKYFCASDFDGTLHPFRVPLDSLGSNVVLASDAHAYDVYIYNRYGTLLMSRYNVGTSSGGAMGGVITSSDGSITVTPTVDGYDLSTRDNKASTLRAAAEPLYADGFYSFRKLEGEGESIYLDNGNIKLEDGWYHFSATVKLNWNGNIVPNTGSIRLYSGLTYDIVDFDYSYNHVESILLDGDIFIGAHSSHYISFGRNFTLGITGMPTGMVAELVDCDIHSIIGQGVGGTEYFAGNGIDISEEKVISVDTSVVATQTDMEGKQDVLTAGSNITINDNVISATAAPQEQANWAETDPADVSYIQNKPTELPAAIDNGVELIAGSNITLTNTLSGVVISASGGGSGGSTPWTYYEDTTFDVTVTADEVTSSFFERLVPITSQAVLNSGKDFVMIYQCHVESDSTNPPSIPDMTPIKVNVYNYPNHLIDEITSIYTTLGGAALQSMHSHGSVVLGTQMLAAGRLFSVCFPMNTLTVGDKFTLTVRAVYIELTGVNE